ncbi:MAG TPA: hypothetical protein PKL13_01165 [bacterium]|nr:hypothetical protein [bacterium]
MPKVDNESNLQSIEKQILSGTHPLRKMISSTENQSQTNAGFFLFIGGLRHNNSQIQTVQFSWKTNDGSYAISKLNIEDVRIKINNSIETPYVTFNYEESEFWFEENPKLQKIIEKSVLYAEITCNEKDWPTDIKLPMN